MIHGGGHAGGGGQAQSRPSGHAGVRPVHLGEGLEEVTGSFAAIRIPVSVPSKRMVLPRPSVRLATRSTAPRSVNLTAFETRLREI